MLERHADDRHYAAAKSSAGNGSAARNPIWNSGFAGIVRPEPGSHDNEGIYLSRPSRVMEMRRVMRLVVGVFLEEGLTVSSEFGLRSLIRASLRIDIAVSLEL